MRLSPGDLGLHATVEGRRPEDRFRLLLRSGPHMVLGRAWLDSNGQARCDDAYIQRGWDVQGVEAPSGPKKMFPTDGAAFLEQVFLSYQQFPYLWVEVDPG